MRICRAYPFPSSRKPALMADLLNVEAEQAVIGALLLDNDVMARLAGLEPKHFAEPVHARIFGIARDAINAGRPATPITLKFELSDDEGLGRLGGPAYLGRLAGAALVSSAGDMVPLIRELWARRTSLDALNRAADRVRASDGGTLSDITADLEGEIATAMQDSGNALAPRSFLRSITEAVTEAANAYRDGDVVGVKTGIPDLDEAVGALRPGRVYILAGRPSMGKTAVALSLAVKVAQAGAPVAFASLEMPDVDLTRRVVSMLLREQGMSVPYSRIERANLSEGEMRAVIEAAQASGSLPLHYLGIEHRELSRLMIGLRAAVRSKGCKLVVIDYLQLIQMDGARSTFDRVSAASKAVKVLALQLGVPVILLSQLSRSLEERDDKRPQLSDLRASGEIEEDADVVLATYRHEYYLSRQQPKTGRDHSASVADLAAEKAKWAGVLELIMLKGRSSGLRTVKLQCEIQHNHIAEARAEAPELQSAMEF